MKRGQKPQCTREHLLLLLGAQLSNSSNVLQALELAELVHKQQIRDDGMPYLEQHIYPIICEVHTYFLETPVLETAVIVALLHDVLEESA